jgi:asparagine synthetase B (glutamine-hydrolysing)
MRPARDSDVTVLLDGQGGDEHLAGYQDARGAYFKHFLFSAKLSTQGRIPDKVLERNDKKGFEVPQGAWLSGPLRRWAEGVLNSSELRQRGWIDPAMAQQVWKQFLNRPAKYYSLIFRWLSLETWARVFLKPGNSWLEPAVRNRGDFGFRAASGPILISES